MEPVFDNDLAQQLWAWRESPDSYEELTTGKTRVELAAAFASMSENLADYLMQGKGKLIENEKFQNDFILIWNGMRNEKVNMDLYNVLGKLPSASILIISAMYHHQKMHKKARSNVLGKVSVCMGATS
jgi:hypothetical protein